MLAALKPEPYQVQMCHTCGTRPFLLDWLRPETLNAIVSGSSMIEGANEGEVFNAFLPPICESV